MDLERGIVNALFYDYPPERLIELMEDNKDWKWLLAPIPELLKWRLTNFTGSELEHAMSVFQSVCKSEFAEYDEKLWPLLYISKVGGKLLKEEHRRPVVKFSEYMRWRVLTLNTGEDLLSLSWLAMLDKGKDVGRTDFAWEDTLQFDEKSRNLYMGQKSLTDLHAHIGHMADAINIRWIYWMNNCWDKPKMKEERKWVFLAAVIRYYLFRIVTGEGCPNKQVLMDVLAARAGGEALQTLHNDIYKKVDHAFNNSVKPNIDGIEHWDYALQADRSVDKAILKSPYTMLAGERWLVYSFFKKLYKRDDEAERFAMMFYLYLLIKVNNRKKFILTNGLIGLSNYQDYEKEGSKDDLDHCSEAKRRYGVQTSLGAYKKNYLEARIRGNNPYDYLEPGKEGKEHSQEREDEPRTVIKLEVPLFGKDKYKRERLLNRVRLVVTYSKKQYSRDKRLAYFHGMKADFDDVINRVSRNKRLKQKEFCLVGIDFSSSDKYARPEVYAQLVRYARRKHFNRFTYHAGEDFFDLLDGLRTIDDILTILRWDKHCRMGHAIALGIVGETFYKNRGWNVIATKQVLLDNLVWYLAKMDELQFGLPKTILDLLERKARTLYEEIGYGQPFNLDKYQKSMRLRGDHPMKGIRREGGQLFIDCALDDSISLNIIRSDNDVLGLFEEYYNNIDLYKKGCEMTHWKMPKGFEKGIDAIQGQLLKEIEQRQITIETCPTSNYMIGPFERYDELPLIKFLHSITNSGISVNTDDKGIIATSIEGEYALIVSSMAKKGEPNDEITKTIDRIIKDARDSRFCV